MDRHRKAVRIATWCFVLIGSLVMGIAIAALGLSETEKKTVTVIWLAIAVGIVVFIDVLWIWQLSKQINHINKILTEELDPDRYIEELNALLEGKRSLHLRQLRLMNLGAAYCDKKDYKTAKNYFLQIRPSKLSRADRWSYWANLAMVHFYLGEDTDACSIMTQQQGAFEGLKKIGRAGDLLVVLSIFEMLAKGENEAAKQYLEEQQPIWENPRNADVFAHLRDLLGS